MRVGLDRCYLSWILPLALCNWCNAWLFGIEWVFMLRLRIPNLLPIAWLIRWRPMNQVHDRWGYFTWWHLNIIRNDTIFVGGSEIVLDGFDDVGFDVLFLFEYELCSVDELAVFVISEVGCGAWCCTGFGDLFGECESGKGFDETGEHWIISI